MSQYQDHNPTAGVSKRAEKLRMQKHAFSLLSTIFCTIRSTRSNSGHISVHVPVGVIARFKEVGWLGSAIWPEAMASARPFARLFFNCEALCQLQSKCAPRIQGKFVPARID